MAYALNVCWTHAIDWLLVNNIIMKYNMYFRGSPVAMNYLFCGHKINQSMKQFEVPGDNSFYC